MIRLYILDVPEFRPVIDGAAAHCDGSRVVGDYVELRSERAIAVDRRAAGSRLAVWFSAIAGLLDGTVVQYDVDTLRIEPAGAPPR